MNERIAELWNKAAKSTKDDSWSSQVTFVEKFAQLIIREYSYDCMDVTSNSEHIQFVAKKWGVEL